MINVFECCTMYTENLVRTHNHAHSERTTHYHDTANACACAEQRIRGSKHRFLSSILKLSYAANSSSFHLSGIFQAAVDEHEYWREIWNISIWPYLTLMYSFELTWVLLLRFSMHLNQKFDTKHLVRTSKRAI